MGKRLGVARILLGGGPVEPWEGRCGSLWLAVDPLGYPTGGSLAGGSLNCSMYLLS